MAKIDDIQKRFEQRMKNKRNAAKAGFVFSAKLSKLKGKKNAKRI